MISKGFTHSGMFHADDVFATALLRILNPEIDVIRGNIVPDDFDGIVYDIGMGEYDHHQIDKKCRENDVPYAAFGLLWRQFGNLVLTEYEDVEAFDKSFVQPIDLSDNTGQYEGISLIISDFNMTWENNTGNNDENFWRAVDFAQIILQNRFRQIIANSNAKQKVRRLVDTQEGCILEMPEFLPWKEVVCPTGILYVIFPSARGGYMIQSVPKSTDDIILKKEFPESWRGKSHEQLRKITGIDSFNFCHMSGFICAADTLEDARKVALLAYEL